MKQFRTHLTRLLLIVSLLLPWATTEAMDKFEKAGIISSIGYDKFSIRDQEYRLAPRAKLKSNDAARGKFSDFRKGDRIYIQGIILNNIYYVDIIVYETPDAT